MLIKFRIQDAWQGMQMSCVCYVIILHETILFHDKNTLYSCVCSHMGHDLNKTNIRESKTSIINLNYLISVIH